MYIFFGTPAGRVRIAMGCQRGGTLFACCHAVLKHVPATGSLTMPNPVHPSPSEPTSLDLRQRITRFLQQRGVPSVKRLQIEVSGGIVTLRGTVSSFYERQLCISCCEHVAGVMRLVDDLQVQLPRLKSA